MMCTELRTYVCRQSTHLPTFYALLYCIQTSPSIIMEPNLDDFYEML